MNLPNMLEAKKRSKNDVKYIYDDIKKSNSFKGLKYYIKTYGCQMNVHDSEEIKSLLENIVKE